MPSPEDLPQPAIELVSACVSCIAGRFQPTEPPVKPLFMHFQTRGASKALPPAEDVHSLM